MAGRPRKLANPTKVSPTLERQLIQDFDAEAERLGLSRNDALAIAMKDWISKQRQLGQDL